ncbi:MAG TPA: pentapeptide repeat-containing protein [Ktedonobacteraceae bacterium]|nr:pentapeptide repeat-containing protein [Ktedonobacteraceae bacterium]
MANQKHLERIREGPYLWNEWRDKHPEELPDLSKVDLSGAYLNKVNLSSVNLEEATLRDTDLWGANLNGAILRGADLSGANLHNARLVMAQLTQANLSDTDFSDADLTEADLMKAKFSRVNLARANLRNVHLSRADLQGANLSGADLRSTHLEEANLSSADLSGAILVGTLLERANLTNCCVYGAAAWDVQLEGALQVDLVITPPDQPKITVDNLKIAQFIYLLLNNKEIREVIDTIAKKAVLILGRFTPERKAILDALREALRKRGYVPILFDFDKPSSQDLTETISTLAHLARFIIVDLTDPSSAPYEVGMIASDHIRPIQAIFQPSDEAKKVFAMFPDLVRRYHWVLPPFEYRHLKHLLDSLQPKVIKPAEQKAQELEKL